MQKQHTIPPRAPWCRSTSATRRRVSSTAVSWSTFRRRGTPPIPRRALPTVMMIGGEFNTPADWMRAGNAVKTIDDFAAAHGGNAPVFVFVDSGGAFNNDTECVNGTRGNAADHLTKDVVPFHGVELRRESPNRANWGVVGWSMGGTCAVDLAVMHPDMFSAFEDIAGDLRPNAGTKAQTIARLFGGNAAGLCRVRSDDGHRPPRAVPGHGRLVRHQRPPSKPGQRARPSPMTRLRRRTHCVRWAAPGIKCAVVVSRESTTGLRCHAFAAGLSWRPVRGHPSPVWRRRRHTSSALPNQESVPHPSGRSWPSFG